MADNSVGLWNLRTDELALVISLAAFLLPVLIQAYKWLRTSLEFQAFRSVELNFGQLNSNSVGLIFTIMARHGRYFVRNVAARVLNVTNGQFRDFEWILARSRKLAEIGGQHSIREEIAAEVATPFVILDGESRTLDLILIDWPTNEIAQKLTALAAEQHMGDIINWAQSDLTADPIGKLAALDHFVGRSAALKSYYDALWLLDFWQEGVYVVEVSILTSRGTKRYFVGTMLTKENIEEHRKNCLLFLISSVPIPVPLGLSWSAVSTRLITVSWLRGRILFWMTRKFPSLLQRRKEMSGGIPSSNVTGGAG